MRRINVHLDEELDAELAAEAARLGRSKADLLREAAREWLDRRGATAAEDAWAAFTGAGSVKLPKYDHLDDLTAGTTIEGRPSASMRSGGFPASRSSR